MSSVSSASGTSTPSPSPQHTSTGAIAGGVVGGIAGVALLAFLIFFLFVRRRRRHDHRHTSEIMQGIFDSPLPPTINSGSGPSMSSLAPVVASQASAWNASNETPSRSGYGYASVVGGTSAVGLSERDEGLRGQVVAMQEEIARLRSMQLHHEAMLSGTVDTPPEYDETRLITPSD